MKSINLTQGKHTLVDDADFDELNSFKWTFINDSTTGHAYRKVKGKTTYMHRVLMNPSKDKEVDHVNRNGLDNRRSNLRICTHAQNNFNLPISKRNKTGATGVRFHKRHGKWYAQITVSKKYKHLGCFVEYEDACRARKQAEALYFHI